MQIPCIYHAKYTTLGDTMKTFTLQEACIALAVEATTLYRWMERAGIEAETDSADKRRRTLTQAQVQQLARAHHRTLPKSIKGEGLDQDAMQQQIDALEKHVADLEHKLERLTSAPTTRILRPPRPEYITEAPAPGERLPGGYVPIYDLVKEHGLVRQRQAIIRHMAPWIKQGHWKREGHAVEKALDQEGVREFMRRYGAQE